MTGKLQKPFSMKLISIIRKFNRSRNIFEFSKIEQLNYLNSLPVPSNDIQRSYNQYLCQNHLQSRGKVFLQNLISAFLVCPVLLFYFFKGLSRRKGATQVENVFIDQGIHNFIPSAYKEGKEISTVSFGKSGYLKSSDLGKLFSLYVNYWTSPLFVLKIVFKVSKYKSIIDSYNPKNIIVASEYSFSSSFLTKYCEDLKIEHTNFMHGEKLFFIRDSFFRFTKCYVWDEHYVKLFRDLKASENQFQIIKPDLFSTERKRLKKYTYYLGNENQEELEKLATLFEVLQKDLTIRPHPRYSDLQIIEDLFKKNQIERTDLGIDHSINESAYVISLYSTVLFQAYINGVEIIIDDVTKNAKYESLKNLDYIMLSKKHSLLSKILTEVN